MFSATFDREGMSETGLICFEATVIGFNFGRGMKSAYFHCEGSFCSTNEEFKIEHTVSAKKSTYSKDPIRCTFKSESGSKRGRLSKGGTPALVQEGLYESNQQ